MDTHRKWYKEVRKDYVFWLDEMNVKLAAFDNEYYDTPGKKAIARINNNLMFHPQKPVYKDYFGAALDKAPNSADFYVEIGLHESMLAGGFWRPDAKILRSIRDAIDYDGEEFKKIITKKSFVKTFAVIHRFKNEEVLQNDFDTKVIRVYQEMVPFRRYLNQAVTV